ncbi:MAG: 2-oxoacid:acceptor oxidoreductase family protein [Anaerohalosphaeraceae bacterium]
MAGMSQMRIIIAGFGGQGVVLTGNLIARAALKENKNVTGMVAYGAEMRGGTAFAAVIVSDDEIACPFVETPDAAIVLNQPSLDKFEPDVAAGGLLLVNTSLVKRGPKREDIDCIFVPATEIAQNLGQMKVANLAALGAFVRHTALVKEESIRQAVKDLFSEKNPALTAVNLAAFEAGLGESRFRKAACSASKKP